MGRRFGPGPVFVYESLILARRRQVYAGRAFFVLAMFVGLAIAWYQTAGGSAPTLKALARTGESFFNAIAGIQLAVVLLVAPVATAGAICHDRARGIFAQLAATDLSDTEIVLGKLASRLAPILGVLACGLPVTALATLLGGIDPQALFSLLAVSVAVAALGCSMALALSVRATKTHDVIIAVLALWLLWLLILPIWSGASTINGVVPPPDWFRKTNPVLLVYAPYSWPGYVTPADVALFVIGVLLLSAALLATTIATVRRGVLEPVQRAKTGALYVKFRIAGWIEWLPGPSLDGNPVLWREWRRNRPSRQARVLWGIYGVSSLAGVGFGIREALAYGMGNPSGFFVLIVCLHLQFLFGLMILSGVAPVVLADERVRRSLEVLMATPLSTWAIVWGKWLGTYRIVLWLAVLPALATLIVACLAPSLPTSYTLAGGAIADVLPIGQADRTAAPLLIAWQMLSYGAAITSMGLVLATWTPSLGRAIAINMAAFVVIAIGWPIFVVVCVQHPLYAGLAPYGRLSRSEIEWFTTGMMAISPFAAPIVTLEWLVDHPWSSRWKFWIFASAWCTMASVFAAAMLWVAFRSFDRCMGRMPERTGEMVDR
jgi:ABC-type transport system involved in multi-copper enzyme maturation permease subunit